MMSLKPGRENRSRHEEGGVQPRQRDPDADFPAAVSMNAELT